MMANEEEVVRALAKAIEMVFEFWIWIWPNEVSGKDFSKDFGRDARGDVQQRISSAFELNRVPVSFFYPLLQGSY